MPVSITFLGTGGAFTDHRDNYHNNAIIHTKGGLVLIDCGGTAPQALRELGIAPSEISVVILTHLHGDHVGGLEQLIWERFYGDGLGTPGFLPTPVRCDASVLPGARRVLEPLIGRYTRQDRSPGHDGWARLAQASVWRGGEGYAGDRAEEVELGGLTFSLHRTPHVSDSGKPCFGVRVCAPDGAEIYFTSDTEFRADIGERFPRATIFHDTTFMPPYEGTVHTHYASLLTLEGHVRARTALMHYTRVPEGIDPITDGFAAAARRFERFDVQVGGRVVSRGCRDPVGRPRSSSSRGG